MGWSAHYNIEHHHCLCRHERRHPQLTVHGKCTSNSQSALMHGSRECDCDHVGLLTGPFAYLHLCCHHCCLSVGADRSHGHLRVFGIAAQAVALFAASDTGTVSKTAGNSCESMHTLASSYKVVQLSGGTPQPAVGQRVAQRLLPFSSRQPKAL